MSMSGAGSAITARPNSAASLSSPATLLHVGDIPAGSVTSRAPSGQSVLRLEGARDVTLPAGISPTWSKVAGLDKDAAEFGLAVIADPAPLMDIAKADPLVRLYRPISEK